MNREHILISLQNLWQTKSRVDTNGPRSREGAEWLAEARAHLELADSTLAGEFAHYMQYATLPLSGEMLGAIWANMQGVLRTAIAKLEAEADRPRERIYGPGDAFELYKDLSELVAAATGNLFIVDPYAGEEVFSLYLSKARAGVLIRLMTKEPSAALRSVAGKFGVRPGVQLECRSTSAVHDRVVFIDSRDCWVIGQSIQGAGMKKPTYLVPISTVSDMARLYEDAWRTATRY